MREIWWLAANLLTYFLRVAFRTTTLPKPKGKTLVILGNGPSLRSALELDLKLLQSNECMVVNKFALSSSYEAIQPEHYVFLDPLFFYTDKDASNLEPKVVADIRSTFEAVAAKTTWPMNIYIPYECRLQSGRLKELAKNSGMIQVIHYHTSNFCGNSSFFFYRNNAGIAGGMNVIHACLALALQMGYKRIALLGADHTWHEQIKYDAGSKSLFLEDSHYNGVTKRTFAAMKTTMAKEMYSLYMCFDAYSTYKIWADKEKAEITNCTPYTYIDEFQICELRDRLSEDFNQSRNGMRHDSPKHNSI